MTKGICYHLFITQPKPNSMAKYVAPNHPIQFQSQAGSLPKITSKASNMTSILYSLLGFPSFCPQTPSENKYRTRWPRGIQDPKRAPHREVLALVRAKVLPLLRGTRRRTCVATADRGNGMNWANMGRLMSELAGGWDRSVSMAEGSAFWGVHGPSFAIR